MGNVSYWKSGRKKLSDAEIEAVRVATGKQSDIAIRFGISAAQVCRIKGGKRRKNARHD